MYINQFQEAYNWGKIFNQIEKVFWYFIFSKISQVFRTGWKWSPPKYSFISSILEWLSNSNETLNSSPRSEESHASFGKFLKTF